MNEAMILALTFVMGGLLGAIFFGGLWWTVRRGVLSERPALWFVSSFVLRTGLVLTGFYVVSAGQWERLLVCLLGFIAARLIVTRLTRTAAGATPLASETRHAS